ncbi:prolyl 4-hydroxylase subunit alpha-2-like [Clytia hemisphaerica]
MIKRTHIGFIFLGSILLLLSSRVITSDVFASTESIKEMLRAEKELIEPLDDCIEKETERLREIKELRDKIKDEIEWVKESSSLDCYVGNPLNAMYAIRRFPNVWSKIHKLINNTNHCTGFGRVYKSHRAKFPDINDANAAVSAILRLQHYYKINANDLSKGVVTKAKTRAKPMDITIKSELGITAINEKKWELSKGWFNEALKEFSPSQDVKEGIQRNLILKRLARVEIRLGNYEKALELNLQLNKSLPRDTQVDKNIRECEKLTKNEEEKQKMKKETRSKNDLMSQYEALCRGEKLRNLTSTNEVSNLVCWYNNKHPLLRYKPQKVERVWLEPEILIYRNLLNDRQCHLLIEGSKSKLKRANLMRDNNQAIQTDKRTSKHAWLTSHDVPIITQMEKRAQAITNLNMKSADQLQVNNYGLGGHYEFHYDWARNNVQEVFGPRGNRIATLMYYLSDVDGGGGTAFVNGKTTIFPTKGDAVFWWNLKRNGEGDQTNLHGGCPVLAGQKWVANWWIHEVGQEFRRPCLKDPNK